MEEINESISLVGLLSDQQQDFESLRRHAASLCMLRIQEKKENVLCSRADYIKHLWVRCQNRNAQIYRLATTEDKEELSYFSAMEFGTVETEVLEALDDLAEHTGTTMVQPSAEGQSYGNQGAFMPVAGVKLPRLNLIMFSGLFTEWQAFRDIFVSLVKNNRGMNTTSKLHYLRGSLTGKALDIISHVDLTAAGFEIAWDLLVSQYDNKISLINAHLSALFAVEPIKKESAQGLSMLRHVIKKHLGALRSLGRQTEGYDDILINRVVALLDPLTKRDWELLLVSMSNYPTFTDLDNFLLQRIRALESLKNAADSSGTISQAISKNKIRSTTTAVRSHHAAVSGASCVIYNEKHAVSKCNKLRTSGINERYELVRKHQLCMNCLKPSHRATECKNPTSCFKCQSRHHTWLHREQQRFEDVNKNAHSTKENEAAASGSGMQVLIPGKTVTHFSVTDSIRPAQILLATARVWVLSRNGRAVRVRALLDPGSTWTFMSSELATLLGIKGVPTATSLAGVGDTVVNTISSTARISIAVDACGESAFETTALVLQKITTYVSRCKLPAKTWPHLMNLKLADDPSNEDPINLLIGANAYGDLLCEGLIKGKSGEPFAQNTVFGWVVCGDAGRPAIGVGADGNAVISHHCITNDELAASLKAFWELEEVPQQSIESAEDKFCEEHFARTHTRAEDGRYIVRLPFKKDMPVDIGDTRRMAEATLRKIETRLARNKKHCELYRDFMKEYHELHHMTLLKKLPQEIVQGVKPVFLPHHPVMREASQTTKLRVVFNASMKSNNNVSLNDCMF